MTKLDGVVEKISKMELVEGATSARISLKEWAVNSVNMGKYTNGKSVIRALLEDLHFSVVGRSQDGTRYTLTVNEEDFLAGEVPPMLIPSNSLFLKIPESEGGDYVEVSTGVPNMLYQGEQNIPVQLDRETINKIVSVLEFTGRLYNIPVLTPTTIAMPIHIREVTARIGMM